MPLPASAGRSTSASTKEAPAALTRPAVAGSTSSPCTSIPPAARRRQIALPMKPPAPVTAALRPSKRRSVIRGPSLYSPRLAQPKAPPPKPAAPHGGPGRGGLALAGSIAVPLARRRLRVPRVGHGRRDRRGPVRARGAASPDQGPRRGAVRASDVGLHGHPRAALRRSGAAFGAASRSATRSAPIARSGSVELPERPPAARLLAARRGHGARPRPRDRPLGLVRRAASGADVDPACAATIASPGRAADGRARTTSAAPSTSPCRPRPPWWAAEQGVMAEELGDRAPRRRAASRRASAG